MILNAFLVVIVSQGVQEDETKMCGIHIFKRCWQYFL